MRGIITAVEVVSKEPVTDRLNDLNGNATNPIFGAIEMVLCDKRFPMYQNFVLLIN